MSVHTCHDCGVIYPSAPLEAVQVCPPCAHLRGDTPNTDLCQPTELATEDRFAHYKSGGLDVYDAIDMWGLGFLRGNALKYLFRAGRKPDSAEIDDLRKARWYIDREIARLEPEEGR
jgi:hypothetical protein